MITLLSDTKVRDIRVAECGQPLRKIDDGRSGSILVREGVAKRLAYVRQALRPVGALVVHEGLRRIDRQRALFAEYLAELKGLHPCADEAELLVLCSRFVAPIDVAPHATGAAVDVSLVGPDGTPLDLGTPVDASPESSSGACYFAARNISDEARRLREALGLAMCANGFVNYPTEWWHWSYGDRYWAHVVKAPAALYGLIEVGEERC